MAKKPLFSFQLPEMAATIAEIVDLFALLALKKGVAIVKAEYGFVDDFSFFTGAFVLVMCCGGVCPARVAVFKKDQLRGSIVQHAVCSFVTEL